jgi:hypothetical protein
MPFSGQYGGENILIMIKEDFEMAVNKLKALLRGLLSHYPVLAALFTVVFMAMCLMFNEAFLKLFSIDYFLFGGLTDAYQIPLSNGIISSLITTSIVIALFFSIYASGVRISAQIKNTSVDNSDILSEKNKFKYVIFKVFNVLIFVAALGLCAFLITLNLTVMPANNAIAIKNGFSERYNVHTKDQVYLCHSFIGGTSQYLFLWNYEDKRPLIVARSSIKMLEQIIPSNPPSWDRKQVHGATEEEIETRKNNLKSKQEAWSHLLSSKCSQMVIWKDIRYKQLID